MNRLFTRTMWALAAILVCAVCIALADPGTSSHTAASAHPIASSASSAGATR
ncbi:MAG TPA: hypothetical protein VHX62_15905 [Solirubrobacteraceae bacterium]|nr:hypothetical protein [Solirubrobacteraceae bacterium]